MKVLYLKIIMIVPILLLVLQGCMLMHFMDDHHSGMMGHGEKEHKDHGTKDHQREEVIFPPISLDQAARKDIQGGVTVEIQFSGLTGKGELAFGVKAHNHVIGVSQHAFDYRSTLANDLGSQVQASRWKAITLSPQHIVGTLYFPAQDESGKPLFGQGTKSVTLRIKDLAGIPERIFQWNVIPGG